MAAVMIQRSLKISEEMWNAIVAKSEEEGYESTSAYIRKLIQQDLTGKSLQELEDRMVATMSNVERRVQSVATAQQASFATTSVLLELVASIAPMMVRDATFEARMQQLWIRIAGDIRGGKYKELVNGHETSTTQTAKA